MSFGVTELMILLVIVALVFGTKRLRNMGSDLGSAVRGFKDAVKEEEASDPKSLDEKSKGTTVEGEVSENKEGAGRQ